MRDILRNAILDGCNREETVARLLAAGMPAAHVNNFLWKNGAHFPTDRLQLDDNYISEERKRYLQELSLSD